MTRHRVFANLAHGDVDIRAFMDVPNNNHNHNHNWENLNPRPYFAASKGRAVTDPIWRHAVAVECGVGQGDETISVWRILHSSMSAWNTTSSKPTRKRLTSHCLSSELPFQPTKCSEC